MSSMSTFSAGSNLALIKYWGKANVAVNLPLNSSVSLTLHQQQLQTLTTVLISAKSETDRLWLNQVEVPLNERIQKVLLLVRTLANDNRKVHIVSENSFPTAAGLASSASGYACLVAALADAFGLKEAFPGQFSTIARQGSGSACRSMYGGLVKWEKGSSHDDSKAIQLYDEKYWPEIHAIVCVVNEGQKKVSSTAGMQNSAKTSTLLKYRAEHVVPGRILEIEDAFKNRDFSRFGEIIMKESNQFHAVCLDSYPPISYLNDTSKEIISLIHQYNDFHNEIKAAYTFDAGPNAVIFVEEENVQHLSALLSYYFADGSSTSLKEDQMINSFIGIERRLNSVKRIFTTTVGTGPQKLDKSFSLIDCVSGLPNNMN